MTTTLITGGTVVNATGTATADVLVDGERIVAVLAPGSQLLGHRSRGSRGRRRGRHREVRHPGWDRRPHPHGAPVRRHQRLGHLRDRDPGGGLGRHHLDHRLRRPALRRAGRGRPRRLAREGGRQLRRRLRVPPDHRRRGRVLPQGDGQPDRRGHHQLQAVHGLPRRLLLRRRADPPRDAEVGRDRAADDDARRERAGDRRPGRAAVLPGQDDPVLPRRRPGLAARGGGDPPLDHARAPDQGPALRGARQREAGGGADRRRPRPRPERVRRDLPAVPLPFPGGTARRARPTSGATSRAPSGSARRRCGPGPRVTRTRCGRRCGPTTCRWCPPTTARSA